MKHPWLAYVVVGLLSLGAAVAIAGLPDTAPVDATIVTPTVTPTPVPTVASETTPPDTTMPGTTARETTVQGTTAPETAPPTTMPATTVPDPTVPDTTVPQATVPDTTGASVPSALPDRSELNVATANGAAVNGAASRIATRLEQIGYVDVLPLNGSAFFEFTTIYFADGFDAAALRLAADLDVLPVFVAPIESVPAVPDLPADIELVAYVGIDRG